MSLSLPPTAEWPSGLSRQVNQAVAYHQAGQLDRADSVCRSILAVHPRHPDALHLLGVSAQVRGENAEAIDWIRRAIQENPTCSNFHNNLGNSLMAAGRQAEAVEAFKSALAHAPRQAVIWLNLANAYLQQKRLPDALACIQSCLEISPGHPAAHLALGKIYRAQGDGEAARQHILHSLTLQPASVEALKELARLLKGVNRLADLERPIRRALESAPGKGELWCLLAEVYRQSRRPDLAEKAYHDALKNSPRFIPAFNGLGVLFAEQGRFEAALQWFQKGIDLDPEDSSLHGNLGSAWHSRGQIDTARLALKRAIELDSNNLNAHLNLGILEKEQGNLELAARRFQHVLQLKPRDVCALNNIGVTFTAQGDLKRARQALQRANRLDPQNPDGMLNLGNVYKAQGRIHSALACYRQAITRAPDHTGAISNYLYAQHYHPDLQPHQLHEAARRWGRFHGRPADSLAPFSHDPRPMRRLRIGYVSPDFYRHSVSFFFQPLIEHHNPDFFQVYAYSEVLRPDDFTANIRQHCHRWRSTVGLEDSVIANQVRADEIDILVDLAGHTAGNRLGVFAHRPAPIQMTWLGYPGTTGLPAMDYRLTDEMADPRGDSDPFYTEQLIRLPGCFLCYDPPRPLPPVVAPSSVDESIVLGSFNNLSKVNTAVVRLWAKILRELPDSKLLLKSKPLADGETRARYRDLFSSHGIDPERILLQSWSATTTEHLELYNRLTVALDPFPYNGTTTTCEALLMGVPVLTLRGNRHSARVGETILTHLGLQDLIAESENDYIDKVVDLVRERHRLDHLCQGLRARLLSSELCRADNFARNIEHCYRQRWIEWCRKKETAG